MTSDFIIETTFSIPIWSVNKARKILNKWSDFREIYINKIYYKEKNIVLFTNFIVTVQGKPYKTKRTMERISHELRAL